ncbi:hypothetical protein U8D42_09280 [Mycobacterium europaeum]|nr:hypothetical protein [Mycobacterium europaeum]MEA1162573.1 hypothetical protein [Mycobacterium europaeum]
MPDNLVALTRDRIRHHRNDIEIDELTDPQSTSAFQLIGRWSHSTLEFR